ncbi:AsnC family transcriptional regulator [Candidatus Woesearchaeota archaeon]|nr:AsnC family transcriptional regulator [Candidatus Woesearchaeota archaeon]
MDKIDLFILDKLKKDSRIPLLQIAKKLGVSEGTIRKRVKDLVSSGKIRKFTIETSEETSAIVGIETETKTETSKIVDKIRSLGIRDIYEVTGKFDIVCTISSDHKEDINNLLEKIRSIGGVIHTETFTILKKT